MRRATADRPTGRASPMSPLPAAPSIASISAWAITSPSECPASPGSPGKSTPARTSGIPSAKRCASTPSPIRSSLIRAAPGAPARRRTRSRSRSRRRAHARRLGRSRGRRSAGTCASEARVIGRPARAAEQRADSGRACRAACAGLRSRSRARRRRACLRPRRQSHVELGAEDLDEVGVRERRRRSPPRRRARRAPRSSDATDLGADASPTRPGSASIAEPVEPVHRAEQVVPRVRRERPRRARPAASRLVVDLEPELDREARPLRLDHRVDVGLEVVDAALERGTAATTSARVCSK